MLLIYPPVAKACEPPAGIAKLSAALKQHNIKHEVVDANLEGMLALLESASSKPSAASDKWTARAMKNIQRNLAALRDPKLYQSIDRYSRAVADINRALEKSVADSHVTISLANYQHATLSPMRSADLLTAASHPEQNPFYPYFSKRLRELIEKNQPAVIGFSLTYLSQSLCTFAMLGFLRREYPSIKLVCGGGLVTSWLSRPEWNNPFSELIDNLIDGPGEDALLKLAGVDKVEAECSAPEYSHLPLKDYLSPGLILPYSGSSGCFWNRCSFCPENAEANLYRPVGAERAAAELSALVKKNRPALVHLLDNSLSPALLKALMTNPPGAPWYGFVRISKELTDPDFCMALKRSGCVMLKLGVESGDQAVLDRLQKGIDLSIASAALKTLKQAGIATYVYLLFGTPAETLDSARKTLDFTVKHADEIGFLNLALFNMPVGSLDADKFGTGSFYEGDLSLYTSFSHPTGWDRKQVRQFIEGEFKRHPAISAILKNDPPFFTSNHAAFFV
jgi:hypothetical protein